MHQLRVGCWKKASCLVPDDKVNNCVEVETTAISDCEQQMLIDLSCKLCSFPDGWISEETKILS